MADVFNICDRAAVSGQVLGSRPSSSDFTMTTDATVEDVPTMSASFTYDGRPVRFVVTPVMTSTDDAGVKGITMTVCRSTDDAIQGKSLRNAANNLASDTQSIDTPPLTAWPSDSVAFVVGTTYTVKLRLLCGASAKATIFGASTPYALYVITA